MLRNVIVLVLASAAVASCAEPNKLPPGEAAAGFSLIFDGRTLAGWSAGKGNWDVDDGALHVRRKGGSIAFTHYKWPRDFDLRFEWKVAPGANSGVHYRDGRFEYQVLDNSAGRVKPIHTAGALYNIAGTTDDYTRAPMQWNAGRIVCTGNRIRHWVNGKVVADVVLDSPEWAAAVEGERVRRLTFLAPGSARDGFLSLSDHTGTTWFRKIRVKPLGD